MRFAFLLILVCAPAFGQLPFYGPTIAAARRQHLVIPCTTPRPVVYLLATTNTTANVAAFQTSPARGLSSNVLYIAAVCNSGSPAAAVTAFTNSLGNVTFTEILNTNLGGGTSQKLTLLRFATNADVASGTFGAGFSASQTGCNIQLFAVSNCNVGAIGNLGSTAFVQTKAGTNTTANGSLTLSALNSSGSNIVLLSAAILNNVGIGNTENRSELSDINYTTPASALSLQCDTNWPVTDASVSITNAAIGWAIFAAEIGALYDAAPFIRGQPADTSVAIGASASFSTYAMGGCTLTYQWSSTNQVNAWTNVPNAQASSLTLASVASADNGAKYRCVVTNAYGAVTSSIATLTASVSSPGFESSSTNAGASVGFLQKAVTNGGSSRLQFVVAGIGNAGTPFVLTVTNSAGQTFTKAWHTNSSWAHGDGWYLINPPAGSNLVTVVFDGLPQQSGMIVMNFTNVNQTTPIGTPAYTTNTGNPTITVTSAVGELVVGGATTDAQGTLAVSGGTLVQKIANIGTDIDVGAAYYTGAASVNANWTATAGEGFSVGAVSIKPP